MAYQPQEIDQKWRNHWKENATYKVTEDASKPKFYILDMFPYPSGSGLHVGHPLGYVASDIYTRYKRLKGFNVLHPMGFDAFGLPAEQYAIETGKHPNQTTEENIATYKSQMNNMGLSFDWDREVVTSNPSYYKWTQWIFSKLYNHCYCQADDKAQAISLLVEQFEKEGNTKTAAYTDYTETFTAEDWKSYSKKQKDEIIMHYRLAYRKVSFVNWCEELGTVLANDEVVNGVSERGGYPVIQKPLLQWSLRITAYAERLLQGIKKLEWSESLKAQQENWIGRSEGASLVFEVAKSCQLSADSRKLTADSRQPTADSQKPKASLEVFTTRPDTIYGVTFMVIAPEHPMVEELTTAEQKEVILAYQKGAKSKSNVDRQASKEVSGVFTGSNAIHPFNGKQIPIWISEYVLIDYGTGAIMAVPSDDDRDNAFAKKFGIEIIEICDKSAYPNATNADKLGKMINSDFLDGLEVKEAIKIAITKIEEKGLGKLKVNYKLRDANFSRQRYWGEPFPVAYDDEGIAQLLPTSRLPLELPFMDDIKPENGKAPLSKVADWKFEGMQLDTDTMPGNAGSSWYFLRYMDPNNPDEFCSKAALDYWQDVDLYVGGTEHAVGHLMYARFWHKFLFDLNFVPTEEPFKKLINQGMIQGNSAFLYVFYVGNTSSRLIISKKTAVSSPPNKKQFIIENTNVKELLADDFDINAVRLIYFRIDIKYVDPITNELNIVEFLKDERYKQFKGYFFEKSNENYICERELEKMSKSKYNVVNPDDVIAEYGADCFRMFEMFLGPIENHKPWQTKGIDGVAKFLRKFWNLFHNAEEVFEVSGAEATEKEMKVLHTCIKKVNEDIERFSFNTCVSAFMICVNDLNDLKSNNKAVLTELVKLLSPFAPHIAEELWSQLGNTNSVVKDVVYPTHEDKYLTESVIQYPVSINGKMRVKIDLPAGISSDAAKEVVLADEVVQKWIEGKDLRKFIFVPGRIVNIVV